MRLRQKKWADYGIGKKEKAAIIDQMRHDPAEVEWYITKCQVPHGIAAHVREYILHGTSYNAQMARGFIPIDDASFYGWCRKVVGTYYQENTEEGNERNEGT